VILIQTSLISADFTVEDILHNLVNPDRYEGVQMAAEDDVFRFMVFGDFGYVPGYFRVGRTGDTMNSLAKNNHQEYMITVGDNFYPNGLMFTWFRFMPWVSLSQFKKSAIKDMKIYPTLGNHDCYWNMYNEIDLSKHDNQWTLNEDYYVMKNELKDGSGKYFVNLMLNSCKTLCPTAEQFPDESGECSNFSVKAGGAEVQAHYAWIEEQLQLYSNDPSVAWLTVSLHHPPFQNKGEKNHLLPLLRKYNIDAIFTGHEHWVEYSNMYPDYAIRFPNDDRGPLRLNCTEDEILLTESRVLNFAKGEVLHQFTVGNGGADLDDSCPLLDQDGDVIFRNNQDNGAMQVEVTADRLTAIYYNFGLKETFRVNISADQKNRRSNYDSF